MPYNVEWASIPVHLDHDVMPVVSQATILGTPDCCALDRIQFDPIVKHGDKSGVVDPKVYAPFGSQATTWVGKWSPFIACLPRLDRSQDIFASFIFERVAREFNVGVQFGTVCVEQKRNEHNPYSDVRKELWGLENATRFTGLLDEVDLSDITVDELWKAYHLITEKFNSKPLQHNKLLSMLTTDFMHEWSHQWATSWKIRQANRGNDGE
jgi:hypothetical protein